MEDYSPIWSVPGRSSQIPEILFRRNFFIIVVINHIFKNFFPEVSSSVKGTFWFRIKEKLRSVLGNLDTSSCAGKLGYHAFALKDLGHLHYFLGIEATKTTIGGYHLHQSKYILDLLKKENMTYYKSMPSPMVSSVKLLSHDGSPHPDPTQYRSIVGALQYASITRHDITFSVNKVCQFMHAPLDTHWKTVKRILRYLSGTVSHGFTINPSNNFHLAAYCDYDWDSDLDHRRSTSGFCIFLGSNLVTWSSKKQLVVNRSSTEAEYRCLASTVAELIWIQSLLSELQIRITRPPTVYCDNLSAVLLTANPIFHSHTKHFELDLHFVCEKVMAKTIFVHHVPARDQLAYGLTKAVPKSIFADFKSKLRVSNFKPTLLVGG
ncbi:uncharacterized mitochondrial protein AtMg00810-like [Gastrolobium bilobum]|uniref:uncharacterized mitochondrial protein AtMg00810-like n=1 Tax=Gastrolobium bilobum TaxID=150636 RepID=UPI002AB1B706|nr:uncharacterized mitochondrial protein AtMg00810-like [Gastrolobium bilobum]